MNRFPKTLFFFTLLFACNGSLQAAEDMGTRKIIIAVIHPNQADPSWMNKMCSSITDLIRLTGGKLYQSECNQVNNEIEAKAWQQSAQKQGGYFGAITYKKMDDSTFSFDLENWFLKDEAKDRKNWNWKFNTLSEEHQKEAILKALKNYFEFQASEKAHPIFTEENQNQKYYLRAGIEIAVGLGLTTALYYTPEGRKRNEGDWMYPSNFLSTLKKKLSTSDALRFDDNSAPVNNGHVGAGAAYYLVARGNGLSVMESFLYTFAASAVWETFCEYREVISLNDQIVTSISGPALGEVFYQLGDYLRSGPKRSPLRNALANVFDPATSFNNWLNDLTPRHRRNPSEFGFESARKAKFEIFAGINKNRSAPGSVPGMTVGINTEINKIPFLDSPGQVKAIYPDTVFTKALIEYSRSKEKGMDDFLLETKAVLAAYYQKKIELDEEGEPKGYRFFVGPSSALEFRNKNRPNADDWLHTFHLLGPSMDLVIYHKGWRVYAGIDLYGDFAAVHSYALDDYKKMNGTAGLPGVQRRTDGYYYGLGLSESLILSAAYGRFEMGSRLRRLDFINFNGRDQYEKQITKCLRLSDSLTEAEFWMAAKITKTTSVEAYLKRSGRVSEADSAKHTGYETHYGVRLRYTFN